MPIQKFLDSPDATKNFSKYPFATVKEDNKQESPPQNSTETATQIKPAELLPSNRYIPLQERMRLSAMAEESTRPNIVTEQNEDFAASNSSGPNTSSSTAPTPESIQNSSENVQKTYTTDCYKTALGVQSLPNTQKILKMKIIPPFRKEHFENTAFLEQEISKAYSEILQPFQPTHRPLITISRTIEKRNGKSLHTLLVTAPQEAEQDVENIKINGPQMKGRTIFPTGEDFYQIRSSQFPRKVWLRITNLPYLCNDVSLMEMLNLPDQIQPLGPLQRETINTEYGQIHSGKARIQVSVPDAESINRLREWSFLKNGLEITQWCDIPIYMSAPSLHQCTACKTEGRLHVGHDILWCRINRNKKEQNVTTPPQTTEDESTPIAIEEDNIARTPEDHNNNGTDQQQGQHETSAVIQSEAEVESDKEESELEEEQWVNNTSKNKNNSGIKRPNPPSDTSGTPRKTPNNKFQILGNSSGDETPNNKENKKQKDTQHTRVQKKKKQKTVDNGKNG